MNNSQVAHAFANQLSDSADGSNFFFEGLTIYSYGYHFPIAKFVDCTDHTTRLLFTLDRYGNTTAKHIGHTASACSHLDKIYVYDVNNPSNLQHFEDDVIASEKKLAKARKPQKYIDEIESTIGRVKRIKDLLNVKVYKKDYPTLYSYLKGDDIDIQQLKSKYKKYYAKLAKEAKEKLKRQEEKRRKRLQEINERLTDWENDLTKKDVHYTDNIASLRYNPNTDKVETSKGITMTVQQAKALYKVWEASPERLQGSRVLERYRCTKCTKDTLIVGCHTIHKDKADRLAKELNF